MRLEYLRLHSDLESPDKELLLASCTCATLRRATRAVSQLYDLVLTPTQLRISQFTILTEMYEAGQVTQCRYSRENDVAVETLSRRFGALR